MGLEPITLRLQGGRSTIELLRQLSIFRIANTCFTKFLFFWMIYQTRTVYFFIYGVSNFFTFYGYMFISIFHQSFYKFNYPEPFNHLKNFFTFVSLSCYNVKNFLHSYQLLQSNCVGIDTPYAGCLI